MHALFVTTALVAVGPAALEPTALERPLRGLRARLGFPSPAEDFEEGAIDLNRLLVRNPPATYYYRAAGDSMRGVGVFDGDLLAVDRSVTPVDGDLVLAIWEGNAPACKILHIRADRVELHSADPRHPPIVLDAGIEVETYAIVGVVRQVQRGKRRRVRPD
jgi:DNA polymerase V